MADLREDGSRYMSPDGTNSVVPVVERAVGDGIYSDEFILEVRKLTDGYSDEVRVGDLRIPTKLLHTKHYKAFNYLEDIDPPNGWVDFYTPLGFMDKRNFSEALNQAITAGFDTIGKIRAVKSIDEFFLHKSTLYMTGREKSTITLRNAQFLKKILPTLDKMPQ